MCHFSAHVGLLLSRERAEGDFAHVEALLLALRSGIVLVRTRVIRVPDHPLHGVFTRSVFHKFYL
jgi:hypothetical protein